MDRMNQFATTFGFAILLAFAWMAFFPMDIFGLAIVAFTVILVYFLQRRDRRKGVVVIDERKELVRNRSTRLSWLITIYLVGVAFILDHLGMVHLSFELMAVSVVGFMIGSQLFFETYYYRVEEP